MLTSASGTSRIFASIAEVEVWFSGSRHQKTRLSSGSGQKFCPGTSCLRMRASLGTRLGDLPQDADVDDSDFRVVMAVSSVTVGSGSSGRLSGRVYPADCTRGLRPLHRRQVIYFPEDLFLGLNQMEGQEWARQDRREGQVPRRRHRHRSRCFFHLRHRRCSRRLGCRYLECRPDPLLESLLIISLSLAAVSILIPPSIEVAIVLILSVLRVIRVLITGLLRCLRCGISWQGRIWRGCVLWLAAAG